MPERRVVAAACVVVSLSWLLFVAAALLPDVGRGFVKDDFTWISAARAGLAEPMSILRPTQPGFFRPLVAASFAWNYHVFGLRSRPYGLTNLLLYMLCAGVIAALIRQIVVSWAAACVGAFSWAVNPHGIGMAVMWISGRTSLLLTLTATLAAVAFLRRQRLFGLVLFACALLSKEEAVMLPAMIGALLLVDSQVSRRDAVLDVAMMCAIEVLYFVARSQTPAFTFATAPSFYKPTMDLLLLARNLGEYIDRGATIGIVVSMLACSIFARVPSVSRGDRRLLMAAVVWFAAGYLPTVAIPVRSSLYAVFPSVGMAMAVATVFEVLSRAEPSGRRQMAFAVALSCVLLVSPIYRLRNRPWVEAARVSSRAMRVIESDLDGQYTHGVVVLEDEATRISNFRDAFGVLATEALQTTTGRPLQAMLLAPERSNAIAARPVDTIAWYRLERGAVRRVE